MSVHTPKRNVLVVDADKDFQELFSIYLNMRGYEILRADNGVDAIGLLDNQHVDIIVTEWMLPMLDGARFLEWIKQEVRKSLPILVLTAKEKSIEEYIIQAGADAVIYKPATGAEILRKLEELMHNA